VDLSLRPPGFPAALEKWYVDALFDDGSVLLVYLARLSLFGARAARVTAELHRADGTVVRGDARATGVRGTQGALRFGPASIDGDRLRFETPGLAGDLAYRPRHGPLSPREPFLACGHRELTWRVEIPDADVEGVLRWPGGARDVRARGYRDRVYFDLLPWRFPIERLEWGRAVAGAHAATWVRARTAGGTLEAGWIDGSLVAEAGEQVALEEGRVLVAGPVLGIEGLRLSFLRGALAWASGDPQQEKVAAACRIAGEQGVAVHEVVTWGAAPP
jgi:hypothetical protein